jgi:FtsH-binding integral membrane protein
VKVKKPEYDDLEAGEQSALGAIGSKYVAGAQAELRLQFIRKVYLVLCAQLLLTVVISMTMILHTGLRLFVQTHPPLVFISFIMSLVLICAMSMMRDRSPWNLILLFSFTLFESYLVGASTSLYNVRSVALAFAITTSIFASITAYVHVTKRDFSFLWAGAYSALLALVLVSLIAMFWPTPLVQLVLAWVGAVLFSVLILVDTSMLLKNYSVDEWATASINLYLDFLNLFIRILYIVGDRQ